MLTGQPLLPFSQLTQFFIGLLEHIKNVAIWQSLSHCWSSHTYLILAYK